MNNDLNQGNTCLDEATSTQTTEIEVVEVQEGDRIEDLPPDFWMAVLPMG